MRRAILLSLLVFSLPAQDQTDLARALTAPRERINRIDDQIASLLNDRAKIVIEIGAIKKKYHAPVAAPGREEEVLRRISAEARAPLPAGAVRRIYQTIIAEMSAIE